MKRIPFHPLLISLFPVLTLLAHNVGEIKPTVALRSLTVSFLGAALIYLLLRLVCRDWKRSAVLATILVVWFCSYGQIYDALKLVRIAGFLVGRHIILAPVWLATLVLALWWAVKILKDTAALTLALNTIAIALLVLPLFQITSFEISTRAAWSYQPQTSAQEISVPKGSIPPDIYYIILDAYSRSDIMQAEFGYDNATFIQDLTQMGFYVATCSQSNYGQTMLSLASSFNLNYLPSLGDFSSSSTNRDPLVVLLKHSAVRELLEGLGYTTVAFETGHPKTELEDADYYLTPPRQGTLKSIFSTGGLNNFEVMYLHSTAGLLLTDFAQKLHLPQKLVPDVSYPKRKDRERTLFILGQLQYTHVPALQSPKLVFVHLVIPHHPFVFGPNGERVNLPDNDMNGYRDQAIYISKQITGVVKDIITHSDHPPVIVIQGDHGAPTGMGIPPAEHMAILNAYYLPGVDPSTLYASISPVNTFRVIFNQYLGGSYPLLEDVAYYSSYQKPYDFTIMPDPQSACVGK
jgi:hypothetical protein